MKSTEGGEEGRGGGRAEKRFEDPVTDVKIAGKPGNDGRPKGRGPRTDVGREMDGS